MPTLNREQLNQILELMLKNQASDPGSMVVVNGAREYVLDNTEAKSLASVVDGTLTGRLDLGKANERQELQTPETLPKAIIVDGEGKAKIESLEDHVKAALMKDVKDSFLARVMSKDVFNLTVAEAQKVQMIYDLDSRNMIAISPTGDIEALDISEVMDDVNQKVDKIIADANQEDADYIAAQAKLIEEEDRLRRELITFKELSQQEMQTIGEKYNEQINEVYKEEQGQKDIIDPERAAGLNAELEELQRKNIETIKKEIKEAQDNHDRQLQSKQAQLNENIEALGESPNLGEVFNLRKEMNAEIGTLTTLHNGKMDLLRSGLRDQEFKMQVKKVTDTKARAHVARTEGAKLPAVERAEEKLKELEQRREEIGKEIAAKSAEIQEEIKQKEKAREKAVTELKERMTSDQKNAFESRKEELKGSYLPAWLFGTTGLENKIISTMADQTKAMETAQLESVDAENKDLVHDTEIMQEKMRLRGLRASIEATLKARSVEASLEANSVAGYDGERMEEGFDPNAFRSVDPDDPRLRASDSSVISEVSEIDHDDTVRYLKDKEQQLEGARRVLNTATNTLAEAQKGLLSVQAVLTTLEENRSHAQVKKVLYEELLEHAKGARTEVAGMDIVKNTVNGMEGLDQDQKKAMIQELEAQAGDFDPTAVKAYFAAAVRSVSSYVGGTTNEAANKGFTVKNLQDLIKGIEKTIGNLNAQVEPSQAIKHKLEEEVGIAASQVAQATLDVQSRENEVSLIKQQLVDISDSPSTSSASYDDDMSLISGISGNPSYDSNEERLDNTFDTSLDFGSEVSGSEESRSMGLPSTEEVMTTLDENAEQSLLARKKLALLAKLEVMSPAMTDKDGELTISLEYVEKLKKLEELYSGLTAERLKAHDDGVSPQLSFGSSAGSDDSVISAASTESSTGDKVDATLDAPVSAPTPQDLVARYNLCFKNLQDEIADYEYLGIALTGEIGGELVADNLQTVAKQASAITEAEVAKASISRDDAQQITDAAMAELLEKASEVGINLTALTRNNGDNELFNKLKDATLKWPKVDDMGNNILKKDENGNPIPVKDSEGNVIYDDSGEPQFEYEEEEVRIFPEGVVGLVEKGELDFISLDRRYWSNVSTQALNAGIDLLNGLIKMVNYVLSVLRIQIGEWAKYTLPYQEITAAQLANVFAFKLEESSLIKKGVNVEVFSFLNDKARMLSRMQSALAEPEDKEFVTRFSNAVRDNFDRIKTPEYGVIEASKKAMYRNALFGKGTGKERYKGLMKSVSAYAENSRRASEYESLRKTLENTRSTKDTKEGIKAGDLHRLNNTEGLVRGILRSVPLSSGTTLDSEFTVDADADANTIIAAARKLVTSNTTDGKIGRTDVDPASVMKQLDGIQMVADNTAVLNHSKEEEEIKTAKKGALNALAEMVTIIIGSEESKCLQEIEAALAEIKVSLDEKLAALPEAVRKALEDKSIDARVEERLGGMWRINPLKYFFTKNQMRDKVIQEVLAEANDGKEKSAQAVKEVLQLQSMQEDLIGIQQEIMRNNDLMRASTKASVDNKDLHEDVQALYRQALETFPDADFDPSSLESEYKGKKMTVNKVDKDKKYISMPTRMIPVFVKALQEANLDGAYKAAQQAVTEAESAVASQEQTIAGLEEKLDEAQKELDAAQQEHKDFSGEKVMKIQEDIDAPLLQNDAQNPQPTPEWLAVMDRLKAAQEAAKAAGDNVASEKTKLEGLKGVATEAETKLATNFDIGKIEEYQSALSKMSSGLDNRTQAAVKGFKQHKERKEIITGRVEKAKGLMEKLKSSAKPSTPSGSRSSSSNKNGPSIEMTKRS